MQPGPDLAPATFARRPGLFICARHCACAAPSDATGLSQQEVFKDEFAFATDKRVTANTARHLSKDRLRSGFDFDDVIKRLAVRHVKELTDGDLPPAMIRPLYPIPAC